MNYVQLCTPRFTCVSYVFVAQVALDFPPGQNSRRNGRDQDARHLIAFPAARAPTNYLEKRPNGQRNRTDV